MSFFDRPHYAVCKANIARAGVWPEQPIYTRIVWPLTMFAMQLSLGGPMVIVLIQLSLKTKNPFYDLFRVTAHSIALYLG